MRAEVGSVGCGGVVTAVAGRRLPSGRLSSVGAKRNSSKPYSEATRREGRRLMDESRGTSDSYGRCFSFARDRSSWDFSRQEEEG